MQSDVDERVRESRKDLEAEIRGVPREVSAIADRALARAHRANTALRASALRSAGVNNAMRAVPPFLPPFSPPLRPRLTAARSFLCLLAMAQLYLNRCS